MSDERESSLEPAAESTEGASGGGASGSLPENLEVFLAPTRGAHLSGPLGWLTRLYGLDVYGGSQLGRQARLALQTSALLLLVIVSFDLMAWTLLFNSIFHASGDIRSVDWFWTTLAAIFGLLFACAVFIYERQFLTTDTSEIFSSFWRFVSVTMAVGLRVVILVVAALITAQPIELLIFREPIRKRVHEEEVREEIIARKKQISEWEQQLEQLRDPSLVAGRMKRRPESGALDTASTNLANAQQRLDQLQRDLNTKNRQLGAARTAQAEAATKARQLRSRGAGGPGAPPALANEFDEAEREERNQGAIVVGLETEIAGLQGSIAAQQVTVSGLSSDRVSAEGRYATALKEVEERVEQREHLIQNLVLKLRAYIDKVKKDGLNDKPVRAMMEGVQDVASKEEATFSYTFRGTDFFDQLRVLQDRIQARQARWPAGIPQQQRTELAREFALDELSVEQQAAAVAGARLCPVFPWQEERPAASEPEVERRIAEACLFRRSYGVAYAIALVIPLLVFAVKFLIPRELKHYFSTRQQAWAGNPDALSYLRGEQRRREEKQRAREEKRRTREERRRTRRPWQLWGRTAPDA